MHRERYYLLPTIGWVDRNILGRCEFLIRIIPALLFSFFIILKAKPQAILLTGGFACVPVSIAGLLLGVPLFTLVLDSEPGLAVRFFSRFSKEAFLPSSDADSTVKCSKKTITGIPLRDTFLSCDKEEAMGYFSLDTDKKTLLVLGGSRGARFLVELADELVLRLNPKEWQFIIQEGDYRLKNNAENIKGINFIKRMELAYAAADIVISRAGAMLSAEIERSGLPVIFIPYPYASRDHQFKNAKRLALRRDNIMVIRQEEVDIEQLLIHIKEMAGMRISVEGEDSTEKIIERMGVYVWKD